MVGGGLAMRGTKKWWTYPSVLLLCVSCSRGAVDRRTVSHARSVAASAVPSDRPLALGNRALRRATILPMAAHHQHLIGPTLLASLEKGPIPPAVLPAVLDQVVRERQALIGTTGATDVFAKHVVLFGINSVLSIRWGPDEVRRWWSTRSAPAGMVQYVIPRAYQLRETTGWVAGILVQHPRGASGRYARRLVNILSVVEQGADGKWRITVENVVPLNQQDRRQLVDTVTSASLVADLDDAGIARGVVLSMAYELSGESEELPGERDRVREENDWTVRQVNLFPDRLVAFCSVNALMAYAIDEVNRCATLPLVRGIKLHLIGTPLDLKNPAHVEQLRRLFGAANDRRMAIVIHLADAAFGPVDARTFLERVLFAAPDVPVQLAHMAQYADYVVGPRDEAVKLLAEAIAAGNPATKHLYFDIAGSVVAATSPAATDSLAKRMRTMGLTRVLFGSDMPIGPVLMAPAPSWTLFRRKMPLTDDEIQAIARNVAPYLR